MKNIFLKKFVLLLLSCSSYLYSQIDKIDSVNALKYEEVISNLQKYELLFKQNISYAQNENYERGIAKSWSWLALIAYLKGEYDKSTEYHFNAINLFEKLNMNEELAEEYGELGYQMKRTALNKANEFMQQAVSLAEKIQLQPYRISKIYDNYGVIKEMQKQYDSAQYYYNKALNIKLALKDSVGIPYSLNKLAVLKATQKKFREAYNYLNLSDAYRAKEKGDFGRVENLSLHADFLALQNDTDRAIAKYREVYKAASSIHYTYLMLYSLDQLSALFQKKQDYQNAFLSFQLYTSLKDSVDNIEIKSRIAQLEIAFETEQKNKQISESNHLLQIRNLQLNFLIVTIILLLFIFVGVYKHNQLKKEKEITELNYSLQMKDALFNKQISEEKLKISRELHDNISSQLTFIIISLENIIYQNSENPVISKLKPLKEIASDALNDLRNTIWAMKQNETDTDNLIIRVTEFISKLKNAIPSLTFSLENQISVTYKLTSLQILNLFRIIQEAVQNSIKHAHATEVKVAFQSADSGYKIVISDNGSGFDSRNANQGNGLLNMERRCTESGGSFELQSDETGTKIICKMPV